MTVEDLKAKVRTALGLLTVGRQQAGIGLLEQLAQPGTVQVVRFCPGCGLIGDPGDEYRDCCPSGHKACMIPEPLANDCHEMWRISLAAAVAQRNGMVLVPIDPLPQMSQAGVKAIQERVQCTDEQAEMIFHTAYDAAINSRPDMTS